MSAGLAVVLTHNVWVADWPVLITILGWLTAIAGAFRLLAPQDAINSAAKSTSSRTASFRRRHLGRAPAPCSASSAICR